MRLTVYCAVQVRMQFTAPLVKHCPFVDEVDTGQVEISWTTTDRTLELHRLAAWLGEFADDELSHEEITNRIHEAIATYCAVSDVNVVTRWTTAGGEVTCRAVPGEPVHTEGA